MRARDDKHTLRFKSPFKQSPLSLKILKLGFLQLFHANFQLLLNMILSNRLLNLACFFQTQQKDKYISILFFALLTRLCSIGL